MLAFKGHSSPQIDNAATPTITLAKHVRRRYFTTAGGPRTHHPMHKYYQQTQLLQGHSRECAEQSFYPGTTHAV